MILEALKDVEETVEYGPDVATQVAQSFQRIALRPLSMETLKTIKEKVKVPANCKALLTPRMNPEIWTGIPSKARMGDLNSQQIQKTKSYGLVSLANIANLVVENSSTLNPEFVKQKLSLSLDGANLLGNGFQQIVQKRRSEVKPHLSTEYASICSAKVLDSEFLFGDNLAEALKASKATAGLVKKTFVPNPRYKPYTRSIAGSLNYYRPQFQSHL